MAASGHHRRRHELDDQHLHEKVGVSDDVEVGDTVDQRASWNTSLGVNIVITLDRNNKWQYLNS